MFLLPAVWKFAASELAVIGTQPNDKVIYHLYPDCTVGNLSVIFLVAHRGYMMWGKPTSSTTETEWRDWAVAEAQWAIIVRAAMGWKQRLDAQRT